MRPARLTLVLLGLFSFLVTSAAAQDLLVNGSFEERDAANRMLPRGWSAGDPRQAPLEFAGEHYEGATSGMIPGDGKDHMWRQTIHSPGIRAFALSAFVKAEGVRLDDKDDYAMLYCHILYKGQPYSSATHFYAKIKPGTYDWRPYAVNGGANNDAPIDMVYVSVVGRLSAGRLYVDQVRLAPNEAIKPESLLMGKIQDLRERLRAVGGVDASVATAKGHLDRASQLLAKEDGNALDAAAAEWVQAARALSHDAWARMYPQAMTDRPVEARMIYHGGMGQTKQACDASLDLMSQAGCNGTYHSLGSWMSVIHHSKLVRIEPGWEEFDALRYSIEQARKRGIKSFAYIAALYGTHEPPTEPDSLYSLHPDWFAKGPDPNMPTFPDPANPEVADFIVKLYAELAVRYDLDAIGLDYIRYPTETALNYDQRNRDAIIARYGIDIQGVGDLSRDPEKWAKIREYRADVVGQLVKRVRDAVKAARPQTAVIACLISNPDEAREYGQNWANSSQWLDYATPMNYDDVSSDEALLSRQRSILAANQSLYIPAIGGMPQLHQTWTISRWAERVAIQRRVGCDGIIIYRMSGFDPAVAAFFGKGPFYTKAQFPMRAGESAGAVHTEAPRQ